MPKKFTTTRDVADVLSAASAGDFDALFADGIERWWDFVNERLDLGADELMIRLDLEDADFGAWYVWLVFSALQSPRALTLEEVLLPDYEANPASALALPQGREQVPFYVLA